MPNVSKITIAISVVLFLSVLIFAWQDGGTFPEVSLAALKSVKTGSPGSTRSIKVSIQNGKDVTVDGSTTALRDFEDKIKASTLDTGRSVVIDLKCDNEVPMSVLFGVHNILRRNDLNRVVYQSDLDHGLPLMLPTEEMEKRIKSTPASDILDLTVNESGRVDCEGKKVPVARINDLVEERCSQNDHLIVSIRPDKNTKYRDFVTVLDQVKKGNASRVFIHDPGR